MSNLLMIYDNEDDKIGYYFEASHRDIEVKLAELTSINLQSLNTELCLSNPVEHYIRSFDQKPFICVTYSHGDNNSIGVGGNSYINATNAYFFSDTLFYACCCLTAKALGGHLRNQGCKVFMGFNTTIASVYNETDSVFQDCENAFIHHFLTTNATIQESLSYMYKKYDEARYFLSENYNTLVASTLERNLSAFVILCNEEDLMLNKSFFSNI